MKIDLRQIPLEGLILTEEILARALDLETEIIKFDSPIRVRAEVFRITNALSVHLTAEASLRLTCSLCLNDFESNLQKDVNLSYPLEGGQLSIDLDPDIREEIILDYPIKPLCEPGCRGLCPRCGKNLNEGKCNC